MSDLTAEQRGALRSFCDTIVPSLPRDDDPDGFWARKATDVGADQGVEQVLAGLPDEARLGLVRLLDAFAAHGLAQAPEQEQREGIVKAIAGSSPEAGGGVGILGNIVRFLYYGAPDPRTGQNPNWRTFGYPGPMSAPAGGEKAIRPLDPAGDLEGDVVIVGSGAGGGVIAGTLAQRGLKVVVLEAAGYFDESDFMQLELPAYQEMYWRGGPTPTADGNVSLQAGTTLGGGTTINWTNCLRTRDWVREEWASLGLEGVDGADFDRHLDHVLERIGATDRASDLNGPHQRMKEGAERLGWSFRTIVRNADLDRYDPGTAGYLGFGDPSGSKLSTEKTFLRDAAAAGAEIVVRCRAQRVVVENGRAAGVEALRADGTPLTVRAGTVVVACGALESPALLKRSGIGGPAAGRYLRLHPCAAVFGSYEEDQRAWWGPPQSGLIDEFANLAEGHGFLIESVQYAPAIGGSAVPWTSGADHKEIMSRYAHGASFIALTRDRGHGVVEVDAAGEAVPLYSVEDPLDVHHLHRGVAEIAKLHEAAGATEIFALAEGLPRWQRGQDLDSFINAAQAVHLGAGGWRLFSAHQMGTCRMGSDPAESVANGWGELHDVPGVWIGDGSAFPTASGTNPMISIMALAHRTAEAIAAGVPAAASSAAD